MEDKDKKELEFRRDKEKLILITDKKYAIKLVERIVFSMVALILTGVLIALISLVVIGN